MNFSNQLKWENPQASIGKQVAATRRRTIWEASGPALELFEQKIFRAIEEALHLNKEHLESDEEISHTVSFHLWMIGRKPESARPTVVFTSKSAPLRAKVIKVIKKDGVLTDYPSIALKSMNRMPATAMGYDANSCLSVSQAECLSLSAVNNRKISGLKPSMRSDNLSVTSLQPSLTNPSLPVQAPESEQVCGIPLLIGGRYEATLGGIVIINSLFYGFTVFHPLNNEVDDHTGLDHSSKSTVTFDQSSATTSSGTSLPQSSDSVSVSIQPNSFETGPAALEDDRTMENGKEGQRFNSVEEVTQLSTLGHVFHTEARSTLDYCVFPLKAPQYHTVNRILFSNDNTGSCQTLVSRSIAAYPRQCEVWLATAKSGTLRGFLSKNPYYIKMAGSNKYQKMWPVQLEKNIVPGDCGAWAVDAGNGKLYGHVVARNSTLTRAYIIPAVEVFRDIQSTYGGPVALPESFDGVTEGEHLARRNYSEAVAAHAQSQNAWNVTRFATSLKFSERSGSRTEAKDAAVALRHNLDPEDDRGPLSYSDPLGFLLDAGLFGYGQDRGSVVFLNGNLSPDWLSAIGSTYLVNPAFFVNHLGIGYEKYSKSPSHLPELPSSNHIKLRYTTMALLEYPTEPHSLEETLTNRKNQLDKFARYLAKVNLATTGSFFVKAGHPLVRDFSVHNDRLCSFEQNISICLQQSRNKWNVLVWFDGARDLDGHVGAPWEHMIELSPPTSQNTSWLSPEPDSWGSRRDATGRNHRAPLARLDYEKQLDYTVAIQDPFYALTGILNFVVRSEHHFLKTIEPTLEYSLADLNNNGQLLALKDISYNKSILERHVRQIKECISCVKSRGGPDWPRPQESISKEATVAAQRLLADLEILLECAENLVSSCHQQMSHIFNSTALQQSGTSIEQTRYIGVLTRITILFLPLSFVSSFWGMSASELGSGSKPLWLWLVTSAPVLVISIVFVYVLSGGLDLAQMLKFRSKGKRSGDLGVKGQELVGESQSGPSLEDMLILNKAQSRAARDRAELAAGPRSRNSFTSAIDLEKNSS